MELIYIVFGIFLIGVFTGGILNSIWPRVKFHILWLWIKISPRKGHKKGPHNLYP